MSELKRENQKIKSRKTARAAKIRAQLAGQKKAQLAAPFFEQHGGTAECLSSKASQLPQETIFRLVFNPVELAKYLK